MVNKNDQKPETHKKPTKLEAKGDKSKRKAERGKNSDDKGRQTETKRKTTPSCWQINERTKNKPHKKGQTHPPKLPNMIENN